MIWLEPLIVTLVFVIGAYIGHQLSKVKSSLWHLGYLVPLLLIWLLIILRLYPSVSYREPFSFVLQSRMLWLRGFFVMVLFCCLAPKLGQERKKRAVYAFTALMAFLHLCPFLLPALLSKQYAELKNTWAVNNVCIQNTSNTCGPASAVTALRALKVESTESGLAIAAKTSMIGGTTPWELAWAIEEICKNQGISCQVKYLDTITQLKDNLPFLATVYLSTFSDHFVAVLEVTNKEVVIGCPLEGYKKLSHEEFEKVWRKGGIHLKRQE